MLGSVIRRIRDARPHSVLAAAWLWLFLWGFPGEMTPDTYEHLLEARSGVYTDLNPPVINVLFWLSDATFGGQVLVFLIQITVFVAGAHLTTRHLLRRHAHWLVLALALFPPVFSPLAVVWKDALVPGLLLVGIGGLLDNRQWLRVVALGALSLAIALRYNAFAAAFPPLLLLWPWHATLHWAKRAAIATVAWIGITAAAAGANIALTDQPMHLTHALQLYDIAGVLAHVDGTLPDAELSPLLADTGLTAQHDLHARIRAHYKVGNLITLITGDPPLWIVRTRDTTPTPAPQREAIARAWKELVTAYPRAYLVHRWQLFREAIALRHEGHAYWAVLHREYPWPDRAREIGVNVHPSPLQAEVIAVVDRAWRRSSLFEPSMYLAISLLLLPLARRQRPVLALLLAGLALESTLFFLASTPDYRYSHWMVICTCVAIVALIAKRMAASRVTAARA